MSDTFSKRHGFYQPTVKEITVRHDAPSDLRGFLVEIAYECGFKPKSLRSALCRLLRKRPDPNNWSEYPNIDQEVRGLVDDCDWYRVYDVIEGLLAWMNETPFSCEADKFAHELNEFLMENGIGWKIVDGHVEIRGPEALEESLRSSAIKLEEHGLKTARNEIHEALHDLSRRPTADVTGAIQHAMAALECVARNACGDEKATLGDIIKRYKDLIPRPLDEAISKAWGFASENARHLKEGQEPTFEEAELIVGISSALCSYLAAKHEA